MRQLTGGEARTLTEARWLLRELEQAATYDPAVGRADAYSLGRTAQASATAADGIFEVLNILTNHHDDPEAARVLHARPEERVG